MKTLFILLGLIVLAPEAPLWKIISSALLVSFGVSWGIEGGAKGTSIYTFKKAKFDRQMNRLRTIEAMKRNG